MKLPAKAAIRRLHMRIYAHRAIQFAHLKVRLADNIAATSLLDDRRKRDLLDGIVNMPDGDRLCHGSTGPTRAAAILPQIFAVPTC